MNERMNGVLRPVDNSGHIGQARLHNNYPFPKRQILDSSKFKEVADDNLNFVENDRKLIKQVENIMEKGEIARNEQFLLFAHCFQKTCTADKNTASHFARDTDCRWLDLILLFY